MDTRTTEDELIERAMELLPRFQRSMFRQRGRSRTSARTCMAVRPGHAAAGAKANDTVAGGRVGAARGRLPR